MTIKDHMGPKKEWSKKEWLEHAWVQRHNPWISEDERQYWRDKIAELSINCTLNYWCFNGILFTKLL